MDAANSVIWLKCNALAVGEHPLMWHITKECKRTIKSSFVSVQPSNWDFDGNGHQSVCPTASTLGGSFRKSNPSIIGQSCPSYPIKLPAMKIARLRLPLARSA